MYDDAVSYSRCESLCLTVFSSKALVQTLIVFGAIYVLIMMMNYLFIKRQSILSLFKTASSSESGIRRLSWVQMLIGVVGIAAIIA